jgi:SIR2-like domain
MNADRFLYYNVEGYNTKTAMQLVKLHGSVNWIKKDDEIEELPYNFSFDDFKSKRGLNDVMEDLLIYPLTQKQLYFMPFIQLFDILNRHLSKRVFWIIVGYSFRDVIIRTMFEKALFTDNKRKLLLVHPNATKLIRPLFKEDIQSQVVCLDEYFAKDKNYTEVNGKITEALLSLEPTNKEWK